VTIATYTTDDGYKLRVFDSMYLDYGLEIVLPDGSEGFYSPHALSNEAYGWRPTDPDEDWEDAERRAAEGDADAFTAWTEQEWAECLEREAWELIEAFLGE